MKTNLKHNLALSAVLLSLGLLVGCSDSANTDPVTQNITEEETVIIEGGDLACSGKDSGISDTAASFVASDHITKANISKEGDDLYETPYYERSNAKNVIKRLNSVISSTTVDGNVTEDVKVHPIVVGYAEQVIGDYALNDGSADIGDPYHIDDIFVSTSLDDGKTWKKINVSRTADKSSMKVIWGNGVTVPNVDYPGHSHKPTMEVNGNNILLSWHDKFCPSGNPLDLEQLVEGETTSYPTDYFKVNGTQGSINYNLTCTIPDDPNTDADESDCAPNGNEVYEVPFSCVWTARGVFDPETSEFTWHQAEQLTAGVRDANKLWIAASADVGFAMSWQEDPEGLREGKGAGPGEGWSGATTNHGADIWYSYLNMSDFALVDTNDTVIVDEENTTKPKSLVNFTYPVRISDNEVCKKDDTKLYCQEENLCVDYITSKDSGEDGVDVIKSEKCITSSVDPLLDGYADDTRVILDGDTGASRPAMSILKTDENEAIVVLAYEETKGLSETSSGEPDQGEVDTDIEVEGKVVYFESFHFDRPVTVSSGDIVNPRVEEQETGDMIFENARRVVIVKQVDPCDAGQYTFGLLYKMGVETRGGASDMYLRMNTGFDYSTFVPASEIPNVSSMTPVFTEEDGTVSTTPVSSTWTPANLEDASWTNLYENTFSPRGLMRGDDIFIGFEYTPNYAQSEQGNVPNNFYVNRYVDEDGTRSWKGPQNISLITGRKISTLDPRFLTTPKGIYDTTGLETDKSNPNVLFLTYGTWDMESGDEEDLFFTRSTDNGATWDFIVLDSNLTANAKLAAREDVEEKEVQTVATPDGSVLYNIWLQEETEDNYLHNDTTPTEFKGLDSWIGRVDYNETAEVTADPIE